MNLLKKRTLVTLEEFVLSEEAWKGPENKIDPTYYILNVKCYARFLQERITEDHKIYFAESSHKDLDHIINHYDRPIRSLIGRWEIQLSELGIKKILPYGYF